MQRILIVAFLLAVAGAVSPAVALTDRDILGKWCGSDTNYDIGRKTLTVIWRSDNERKKFAIDHFEFSDASVIMYWRRIAGEKRLSTQFGEFSRDRRTMIQIKNEAGPRREFRRC
jgi:hypothetical protein